MACGSQFFESDATPLRAVVQVRTDLADGLKREILRVLGLFGPTSAVGSALGPGGPGALDDFGELDRLALQALYRSGIATGLNHLPALEKARDFLAQVLGLVQPGGSAKDMARPFMDQQVALMRDSTDRYIQMQLRHRLWFEHYSTKTRARRFGSRLAQRKAARGDLTIRWRKIEFVRRLCANAYCWARQARSPCRAAFSRVCGRRCRRSEDAIEAFAISILRIAAPFGARRRARLAEVRCRDKARRRARRRHCRRLARPAQ